MQNQQAKHYVAKNHQGSTVQEPNANMNGAKGGTISSKNPSMGPIASYSFSNDHQAGKNRIMQRIAKMKK